MRVMMMSFKSQSSGVCNVICILKSATTDFVFHLFLFVYKSHAFNLPNIH